MKLHQILAYLRTFISASGGKFAFSGGWGRPLPTSVGRTLYNYVYISVHFIWIVLYVLLFYLILVQIINGTDILEVLHDFPELKLYVHSLYYCEYDNFFKSLSELCSNKMIRY